MLMDHLQVSSNLHDPMGRARFPGEAQTGKLTGKLKLSTVGAIGPKLIFQTKIAEMTSKVDQGQGHILLSVSGLHLNLHR